MGQTQDCIYRHMCVYMSHAYTLTCHYHTITHLLDPLKDSARLCLDIFFPRSRLIFNKTLQGNWRQRTELTSIKVLPPKSTKMVSSGSSDTNKEQAPGCFSCQSTLWSAVPPCDPQALVLIPWTEQSSWYLSHATIRSGSECFCCTSLTTGVNQAFSIKLP